MPKRKRLLKIPDYEGMGLDPENALIQKTRPLQTLSETSLTLPELKILDLYLARINSHDPDKRTVRLERGELEKALGITQIKQDDLKKRLRNLFQTVEVKDENKRKGFKLINLFEEADAEQDENGLWQITLTCTASAREYIFNIDNIGYLRYRLKNVINLTSRYSYVLFLYLLDNRYRKTWAIALAELKAMLDCTAERYNQFKFFNQEVLKRSQTELREKTDVDFEYTPKKRGRNVVAVEFSVKTSADLPNEPPEIEQDGQISLLPFTPNYNGKTTAEEMEHFCYWSDIFDGNDDMAELCRSVNFEFKHRADYERILHILLRTDIKITDELDNIWGARSQYLTEMYVKMCAVAVKAEQKGKPIKNRLEYLCSMLEKNADHTAQGTDVIHT